MNKEAVLKEFCEIMSSKDMGYIVIEFPFNSPGADANYICNGNKEDAIKILREMAIHLDPDSGISHINSERERQIEKGYTTEHDKKLHPFSELLEVADNYIEECKSTCCTAKSKIECLKKAGALIAAEIDRLNSK